MNAMFDNNVIIGKKSASVDSHDGNDFSSQVIILEMTSQVLLLHEKGACAGRRGFVFWIQRWAHPFLSARIRDVEFMFWVCEEQANYVEEGGVFTNFIFFKFVIQVEFVRNCNLNLYSIQCLIDGYIDDFMFVFQALECKIADSNMQPSLEMETYVQNQKRIVVHWSHTLILLIF